MIHKLDEADIKALADEVGCTYDECGSKDVGLLIEGKDGTDAEGMYAFLCLDHFKELVALKGVPAKTAWMEKIHHLHVFAETINLN